MHSIDNYGKGRFISAAKLVRWINTTLDENFNKLEQTRNGATHCRLLHSIDKKSIPLKKVDFNAEKNEEIRENWRLLERMFKKAQINKSVPVERLMSSKFKELLDFTQWFHHFHHRNFHQNGEYDAKNEKKMCTDNEQKEGRIYNKRTFAFLEQPLTNFAFKVKDKSIEQKIFSTEKELEEMKLEIKKLEEINERNSIFVEKMRDFLIQVKAMFEDRESNASGNEVVDSVADALFAFSLD